jgi:uncharacterized protein YqgC (DUF456 family)
MDTLFAVLAVICGLIGFIGAIVPVLPGTIVSFLGLLLLHFAEWSQVSSTQLLVWGIISLLVIALDYVLPGYFSKLFGGSKRGIMGANIGVFAGILFGPWGIILGPFIGAFVGEMLNDNSSKELAFKVACGSLLSFFTGTGLKLVTGGMMFYYIIEDIVVAVSDKV